MSVAMQVAQNAPPTKLPQNCHKNHKTAVGLQCRFKLTGQTRFSQIG